MPVSEMFIVQCQMSYWGYPSIGLHPRLVPTIAYLRSAVVVVVTTIISILKSIQADKSKLSAIYHNQVTPLYQTVDIFFIFIVNFLVTIAKYK